MSAATEDEASIRRDLAATYNLLHRLGLNEGACNHLSALVPGTRDRFLLNRYGLLWSERPHSARYPPCTTKLIPAARGGG